jgi:hypothetical protein
MSGDESLFLELHTEGTLFTIGEGLYEAQGQELGTAGGFGNQN